MESQEQENQVEKPTVLEIKEESKKEEEKFPNSTSQERNEEVITNSEIPPVRYHI